MASLDMMEVLQRPRGQGKVKMRTGESREVKKWLCVLCYVDFVVPFSCTFQLQRKRESEAARAGQQRISCFSRCTNKEGIVSQKQGRNKADENFLEQSLTFYGFFDEMYIFTVC